METLHVVFKGTAHDLPLPHGTATSIAETQQLIAQALDVPPDAQRWFQQKKRVNTSDTAKRLADVCSDTALYLIAGASASQIDAMQQTHESVQEEQRKRATRRVVSIAKRNDMATTRDAVATDYRFHAIEELPHFRDRHRAREILEQLASDRGILAVMAKHKWSVGSLAEMHPDGKVGVDPVCVLGLNQNKGQKILLRLRTDDLLGFRKYLSIKKVLFHELTHNVHSEHDNKFYQLMRQVEKECAELDWTNAGGAAVGGASAAFGGGDDDDDDDDDARRRASSGRKLGGGTATSRLLLSHKRADASEVASACSSQQTQQAASTLQSTNGDVEKEKPRTTMPVPKQDDFVAVSEWRDATASASAASAAAIAVPAVPTSVLDVEMDAAAAVLEPASGGVDAPPSQRSTEDVEMVAPQIEAIPGHEPSEREQRILTAVQQLRARSSVESVARAGALLHQILSNVAAHPSELKFRAIRKANKLFATRVAQFPECLELLRAVGFEDEPERFVLVRQADPALLWLGRATLEQLLPDVAA